jgi:aldose sugar dehydrogenase
MKQAYLALLAVLSIYGPAHTQNTQQIGTTTVTIDTLISTMTVPWEIQLESDDFLWVTERGGIVSRIDLATGAKDTVLDLTGEILAQSESGLLGLALHPIFEITPEVFLVYTYGPADSEGYFHERLVKYEFNDTVLINPQILIDDIPTWQNHAGSRLFFLPDQTLLMSTGERYQPELAQDSSSLAGKFLRLGPNGEIPYNNPDTTSYIYTMGHRNAQGIAMLPDSTIIISEHGPTTDDELSILEPGNNYGWPLIHGFCDENFEDAPCATGLYTEPIHNWTPTIATSDLVYYQNPYFPEWDNRLLMTTLNGQRLVAMELNAAHNDVVDEDHYFTGEFGRLRDIAVGYNKEIYIATNTGSAGAHPIIRITPPYFASVGENDPLAFTIYPNPAHDYLTVDLPLVNAKVRILDMNGREVFAVDHVEAYNKIPLTTIQPGFYMVEVIQPGMTPGKQRLQKL